MKTRKLMASVLALMVSAALVASPQSAWAGIVSDSGDTFWVYDQYEDYYIATHTSQSNEALSFVEITGFISGNAAQTSVSFPSVINGKTVAMLNGEMFKYCTGLTQVQLPASLEYIEEYAFYGCTSLTEITLPETMETLENYVFLGCSGLERIHIPAKLNSIGEFCFSRCSSMEEISVDPANPSYQSIDGALYDKAAAILLTYPGGKQDASCVIPDGAAAIERSAFYENPYITEIIIPDSVTSIGISAFAECSALTSVQLPAGLTAMENNLFYNCTSLTDITLPEGITSIPDYLFQNCKSMPEIKIPDGVTFIGKWAFYNCESIPSLDLPDGLISIGDCAFSDWDALTELTVPGTVQSIGTGAFSGCRHLQGITIEEGVTALPDDMFINCYDVEYINIPASVTSIGYRALYCSSSPIEVFYAGTEEQWNAITIGEENMSLEGATIHFNSTFMLGDLNSDSTVNAMDATAVLISAAASGAGMDSGLDELQQKAADVNSDGEINAVDATRILQYAAAAGAGHEGTLRDFAAS